MSTELPLFPLRSVLCPGVALPLHIFEPRYRLMIDRCLERGQPFGVVLVREGSDVGPLSGRIAQVGTTAAIRRAGAYPDGRLDILTVGQRRFHVDALDTASEPYLVGRVSLLDEPVGPEEEARRKADQVGRRFLEYLELLQPDEDGGGPEIEIEFEIEVEDEEAEPAAWQAADPETEAELEIGGAAQEADRPRELLDETIDAMVDEVDASDLSPRQRRELLMAAARRLIGTDDPTALSYVLTSLIQIDLAARQDLLEAPDTVERLARLDSLLAREAWFLRQGLRPIIIDPGLVGPRRR